MAVTSHKHKRRATCTPHAPAFIATAQSDRAFLACKLQTAPLCRYDSDMKAMLEAAPIAETAGDAQRWDGDVKLQYQSQKHFEQLAAAFGMMAEWRDRVPRAAYHGVVSCMKHAHA